MSCGELYIPTERVSRNLITGRFMKGGRNAENR